MTNNLLKRCKFEDLDNYTNKKLYQVNSENIILYMGIIKNTESNYNSIYNNYHCKIYLKDNRILHSSKFDSSNFDNRYFIEE